MREHALRRGASIGSEKVENALGCAPISRKARGQPVLARVGPEPRQHQRHAVTDSAHRERRRMSMPRSMQLAVMAMLGILSHRPAVSATLNDLQGAWAPNASDCGKIFRKKGRTVEFVRKGLGEPTSFIIAGQSARGPRATCQIRSVRARG